MCGRTFWRSYISSRRRAAVVCSTLALAFASTARNFVGTQLVKAAQTESASAAEAAPRVGGKSSVQSEASAPAFALKRAQKKKSARPPRSWRAQLRAIGAHVRSGRIISAQAIWSSPISPNSFVFFHSLPTAPPPALVWPPLWCGWFKCLPLSPERKTEHATTF